MNDLFSRLATGKDNRYQAFRNAGKAVADSHDSDDAGLEDAGPPSGGLGLACVPADGTVNIRYLDARGTRSQVTVPVMIQGHLLGVLFVDSQLDGLPALAHERVLVEMAGHLEAAIELAKSGRTPVATAPVAKAVTGEAAIQVRRCSNNTIFMDDTYLIKGVAGAILWKLLLDYATTGRTDFSNRELRVDPSLKLPDISDNLEVRLILLQRRLALHGPHLRIEKTGRGLFRLVVQRPVNLLED